MQEQADILFNKAIHLIQMKRYEQAEKLLRNVLELDISYADAYSHLALIKHHQNMYDDAKGLALESLKINADGYYAHYMHSKALYGLGRVREAFDAIAISLRLYPENVASHLHRAVMFYNRGDFKDANASVNRALQIEPGNDESLVLKSQCVRALGNKHDAYKIADDALKQNVESAETWLQKGLLYVELKNYKEAKNCFQNALRLNPNNQKAKEALLSILKLQNGFFRIFESHAGTKLLISKSWSIALLIPHFWGGLLFRSFFLQMSDYFSCWGNLFFSTKSFSANLLNEKGKWIAKIFSGFNISIFLLMVTGIIFSHRINYFFAYSLFVLCSLVVDYGTDGEEEYSKTLIMLFFAGMVLTDIAILFNEFKGAFIILFVLLHFVFNLLYYVRVKVFDLNKRYIEKN